MTFVEGHVKKWAVYVEMKFGILSLSFHQGAKRGWDYLLCVY